MLSQNVGRQWPKFLTVTAARDENLRMRMKAKLLDTIVRAGGNPVLPAKGTETLDALAPVLPCGTGVRYPKHGNLWTEVNGERRIRKTR